MNNEQLTLNNQHCYLSNLDDDFVKIENEHFWYTSRRKAVTSLLSRFTKLTSQGEGTRGVEIGCGTGGMQETLSQFCHELIGVEPFENAARVARLRNSKFTIVQTEGEKFLAEHPESFELIATFDVLEHLEDDMGMLRQMHSALVPGGSLVITVPASKILWSSYDLFDQHWRRYERTDLQQKLEEAGFSVSRISYLFMCLFPVVYLVRKFRDILALKASEQNTDLIKMPSKLVNSLLKGIFNLEIELMKHISLPIGSSLVCIASKTKSCRVGIAQQNPVVQAKR
jgi:SAM-dependent methyltransferase